MLSRIRTLQRACFLLVACSGFLLAGCSDRSKDGRKSLTAEGIAKSIDLDKRAVSMTIVDGKGNQREVTGTFRDDTEVTINGRVQSIKDIKPGDKVMVEGYREGEGMGQRLVATKVEVKRAENADWKPTGKSADSSAKGSTKQG